jgi:hypothetical protein
VGPKRDITRRSLGLFHRSNYLLLKTVADTPYLFLDHPIVATTNARFLAIQDPNALEFNNAPPLE